MTNQIRDINYYKDYISDELLVHLLKDAAPVKNVPDLLQNGSLGGLETSDSLQFLCKLYEKVKVELNEVLSQRIVDREFIDSRTKVSFKLNRSLDIGYLDSKYETIIGQRDSKGRIVVGPLDEYYAKSGKGKKIAELPEHLRGYHVTLFGPPDDAKLSINAMNAFHRKLKDEPKIVSELLAKSTDVPKWGADDEDSKTPLREDLISAGQNLTDCFDRSISFKDPKTNKIYNLETEKLSLPIKRFPGLALPSLFLFYKKNPIPLHLYDFALHLFRNYQNPSALTFYVPKLETPEEARYIKLMVETAEKMITKLHSGYKVGTIRLIVVLENPRLIFRTHEMMDELYPYFAGASLGWHDYLASTARLFKEDSNYRIPVKADPNIVIKYIKASHELLANVVGSRGGIKIGGMYGVLPIDNDLKSESFQLTIRGYIKDVITQMKRDLSGFWVAHPDFVRLGMALVEAWKVYQAGDKSKLKTLVKDLLNDKYQSEILEFIEAPDIASLDMDSPMYARALIVADVLESDFIANDNLNEVRYNVFQSLQYLTDWLSGNGCVALPADINGVSVRVMDDLATAERSRWEVWHEIYNNRVSKEDLVKIAAEEMIFIRKDLSNEKKIVQVKWNDRTEKWYPIAYRLMLQLMTAKNPVEFASELLLPFTIPQIRQSSDPLKEVTQIDPKKYGIDDYVEKYNYYFSVCGVQEFSQQMAALTIPDLSLAEKIMKDMSLSQVKEAARFHGDIGESKKTLDEVAAREQSLVEKADDSIKAELSQLGAQYLKKFGVKFLISAQGKNASEMLEQLKLRLNNSDTQELTNAREALWQISKKRLGTNSLKEQILELMKKHQIMGAQLSVSKDLDMKQNLSFGFLSSGNQTKDNTHFQYASLSKTLGSCFAIEYFNSKNINLSTSVNELFAKTKSSFRIQSLDPSHPEWADQVRLIHLMEHTALNMHYVNGITLDQNMPSLSEFLNQKFGYEKIGVINPPGEKFQYSGGGFIVLEYLIESLENKNIQDVTKDFFKSYDLSFNQKNRLADHATGYREDKTEVRKMFPSFAAGLSGSAQAYLNFMLSLAKAYHLSSEKSPIHHSTAVEMLFGKDKSSQKFMSANMGLGVFTVQAGPNKFALHQGANDGFRALSLVCFDGPDFAKGFVLLCNAEFNGVLFISEVAQLLCRELKIDGINTKLFPTEFDQKNIPKEEVVNQAYKKMIFDAFEPDLPEKISNRAKLDPFFESSLARDAQILEVSNQGFARAENLFSPYSPVFEPELYGRQGKVMDSWESVRHNQKQADYIIFELKNSEVVRSLVVSTEFHLGNQAPAVMLEAFDGKNWITLLDKIKLQGHALKYIKLDNEKSFQKFRVSQLPDGGLTRFAMFDQLLEWKEEDQVFKDRVPQPLKPMTPKYEATQESITANLDKLKKNQIYNIASSAYGAKIVRASNEHYGPAEQVISPYPPLHMFDGFESARSRDVGHFEEVVVELAKTSQIEEIEIDFRFFKNNNPFEIEVYGLSQNSWVQLLEKKNVKAYAGNTLIFKPATHEKISQIRIKVIPDGGMNRVRVFAKF